MKTGLVLEGGALRTIFSSVFSREKLTLMEEIA